jgi:ADP-heptose:LPS heptosyltransferase
MIFPRSWEDGGCEPSGHQGLLQDLDAPGMIPPGPPSPSVREASRYRPPAKLILVRNDRLGDFLLAWPAFAVLRAALPRTELVAWVPAYTEPLARICPSIDTVVVGDPHPLRWRRVREVADGFRRLDADGAVVFATRLPLALALWRSGIRHRVAPATKIDQLFYNETLKQRRSRSLRPEWAYNVELVFSLLGRYGIPPSWPKPPYLSLDPIRVGERRRQFFGSAGIPEQARVIFLHPGHGGSAPNWKPEEYGYLARRLLEDPGTHVIVTAGAGEAEAARRVVEVAGDPKRAHCYDSPQGLVAFAEHIAFADLWISGSTGPLHLAGALNRPTLAFYPTHRSGHALRWQTINEEERRWALDLAEPRQARARLDQAINQIRSLDLARFAAVSPRDGRI